MECCVDRLSLRSTWRRLASSSRTLRRTAPWTTCVSSSTWPTTPRQSDFDKLKPTRAVVCYCLCYRRTVEVPCLKGQFVPDFSLPSHQSASSASSPLVWHWRLQSTWPTSARSTSSSSSQTWAPTLRLWERYSNSRPVLSSSFQSSVHFILKNLWKHGTACCLLCSSSSSSRVYWYWLQYWKDKSDCWVGGTIEISSQGMEIKVYAVLYWIMGIDWLTGTGCFDKLSWWNHSCSRVFSSCKAIWHTRILHWRILSLTLFIFIY